MESFGRDSVKKYSLKIKWWPNKKISCLKKYFSHKVQRIAYTNCKYLFFLYQELVKWVPKIIDNNWCVKTL